MMPIGEMVSITILRNGKTQTTKVKIAKPLEVPSTEAETVPQFAGATLANLKAGARGKIEGVIVIQVDGNSPAWRHGLRPGDIIFGVNRKKVRSVQEFLSTLQSSEDRIILNLLRGDFRLAIVIR
jgi:serine protease Do/serine protease DegQ